MTDRTLTLTITIPEDMDDNLGGMGMSTESHGIDRDIAPILLLAAAETMIRVEIRQELEQQNPMTTGDVLDAMSFLNARLKAVDAIMHLPETAGADAAYLELQLSQAETDDSPRGSGGSDPGAVR